MLRLLKFLLLFSLFFVSCRSKNKVEQPMIKDFDLLQRANNDYTTIDLEHAEEWPIVNLLIVFVIYP